MRLMEFLLQQYTETPRLPDQGETIPAFAAWCDQFLQDHPIVSAVIHADQSSTLTLRGHYGEFVVDVAGQEPHTADEPTIDFLRQKDRGRSADPGYTDDIFNR